MLSETNKISSCALKAMRCMQHDAQEKKNHSFQVSFSLMSMNRLNTKLMAKAKRRVWESED